MNSNLLDFSIVMPSYFAKYFHSTGSVVEFLGSFLKILICPPSSSFHEFSFHYWSETITWNALVASCNEFSRIFPQNFLPSSYCPLASTKKWKKNAQFQYSPQNPEFLSQSSTQLHTMDRFKKYCPEIVCLFFQSRLFNLGFRKI
mgnify:CR=1 FL=1